MWQHYWQDVFLKCHWLVLSKGFPESAFTINLDLFLALPYQSTVLSYPMPSYQIETPSLKTKVSEMTELLVKKFEGRGQSLSYAVPKEKV